MDKYLVAYKANYSIKDSFNPHLAYFKETIDIEIIYSESNGIEFIQSKIEEILKASGYFNINIKILAISKLGGEE